MIQPTNGRVVLFTPSREHKLEHLAYRGQPLAAHIAHVFGDRMVNLMVIGADGASHAVTSVPLLQDDDAKPEGGFYCEWMQYQKGQAAKAEQDIKAQVEAIVEQKIAALVSQDAAPPHAEVHD